MVDYIVLSTLSIFGPLAQVPLHQIRESIVDLFSVEYEVPELRVSVQRLAAKEMIKISGEGDALRCSISEEANQRAENNTAEIHELEERIFHEWEERLLSEYEDLNIKDHIPACVDRLKQFITQMLRRHGVECTALLYPERDRVKNWIRQIGTEILGELEPISPQVDVAVRMEIPRFFQFTKGSDRARYVSSLLNASFFWHVTQIDEECSELLRSTVSGQTLVLDTNILYYLMGFEGRRKAESVATLVKLAKRLEYSLAVTTKTIDEFHYSVRRSLEEGSKLLIQAPHDLADIAASYLGEDFMTNYWSELAKSGLGIEDFVAERGNIEELLTGLDIVLMEEHRDEIENSSALSDQKQKLMAACGNHFPIHIIEHDAFHRELILKLRGEPKYSYRDAAFWFLTNDGKLPIFDREARTELTSLPFCLTTSQWIQLNRPLLPRVESDAQEIAFAELVVSPFVRSFLSTNPISQIQKKVFARLIKFQADKQLSLRIVTDAHFLSTLSGKSDEEVAEAVESKFADVAKELAADKERLEKENLILQQLADKKDREASEVATERNDLRVRFRNLEEANRGLQKRTSTLELKSDRFDESLTKSRRTNLFLSWTLFSVLFFFANVWIWADLWPLTKALVGIGEKASASLALLFLLLAIPGRKQASLWLTCSVAFLVVLVTFVGNRLL